MHLNNVRGKMFVFTFVLMCVQLVALTLTLVTDYDPGFPLWVLVLWTASNMLNCFVQYSKRVSSKEKSNQKKEMIAG